MWNAAFLQSNRTAERKASNLERGDEPIDRFLPFSGLGPDDLSVGAPFLDDLYAKFDDCPSLFLVSSEWMMQVWIRVHNRCHKDSRMAYLCSLCHSTPSQHHVNDILNSNYRRCFLCHKSLKHAVTFGALNTRCPCRDSQPKGSFPRAIRVLVRSTPIPRLPRRKHRRLPRRPSHP